ncbi:MAG: formylmethanofuran--tetrahydromethanopterin N-formyltransferase [Candidatus Altiarchaeota archaeon]|nr:formylmethanofuran--tetrahydromethanopterin N-formyltransferase [Candidatus Altiarchaeota archaeon]
MPAEIDDTYAEAFPGFYSEVLVTAKSRKWLDSAVNSAIGCATSGIGCGCETGIDYLVEPEDSPDDRIGAAIQFWVASCCADPIKQLEGELLKRIGQCVLTAPTTAVWNLTQAENKLAVGKKIGFFGDGFQREGQRFGRSVVVVPRMMGDFLIEREFGYSKGVMGGNLWFFAVSEDAALEAAELAAFAIGGVRGVVTSFPGGVCAAGSKIGSRYSFLRASTQEKLCPSIAAKVSGSGVPRGVESIAEVVFNGVSLSAVRKATHRAIEIAKETRGLVRISAGNFGGKLGAYKIYLRK